MKNLMVFGFLTLTTLTVTQSAQAQSAEDFLSGFTVKAKIERPMGKIFESGAILCAPQTPQQKYDYAYTFKTQPALEVVEFQVDQKNNGPAGIIPLRNESPNQRAGALQLDPTAAEVTDDAVKFSGDSVDFKMEGNTISLAPVAKVSGTLSIKTMKLKIHVVGSFAQDVEMNCALLD